MIVGVNPLLGSERSAEDLNRPIGDHFVGIHVRRSARTGLKDVEDKLPVELSVCTS